MKAVERLALPAVLMGCASVPPAAYSTESVEATVLARVPSAELAREALELADLAALDLEPPRAEDLEDPSRDAYWHACAYAFAPAVRAARREALAARAVGESAGAPRASNVRVVDHEFGGDDPLVEGVVTFDVLGLLSIGPSGAERDLASVEAVAATARLERAVWAARFDVDRARARVAAARARVELLADVARPLESDLARVSVLHDHGRVSEDQWSEALARVLALGAAESHAEEALARALDRLVTASGLAPDHPALAVPGRGTLDDLAHRPVSEPAAGSRPVDTHPELRAARVGVAVAEARLRVIAAEAWPGLQLGPHLGFPDSGGTAVGGVVQLSLPFPSSWRGTLEAAVESRERSYEVLEEAALARLSRGRVAEVSLAEARGRLEDESTAIAAAAAAGWEATRARFRVREASVEEWGRALDRHRREMLAPIDDAESAALAALDLAEARGPVPRIDDEGGRP